MLAKVHNKLGFPIKVSDVIIEAHGTEKIDLPNGFKYNKNRLSVSYIKTATETKQPVAEKEEEKTVVVEEKVEETKPIVKTPPKPKQKRKKRTTKK